jgi:hypothetical protein
MDLTFEDLNLVPQHHDLDVLVRLGSTARDNEAEEPAHPGIEEGEDHGGRCPTSTRKCQLRAPIVVLVPFSSKRSVRRLTWDFVSSQAHTPLK